MSILNLLKIPKDIWNLGFIHQAPSYLLHNLQRHIGILVETIINKASQYSSHQSN